MVDTREFRFEFNCPRCTARLRLKDRSLVGTQWACPECHTPLKIEDAGAGQVTAIDCSPPPKPTPSRLPVLIGPRAAGLVVAGVLVLGLAGLVFWPSPQPPLPPVAEAPATPPPGPAVAPPVPIAPVPVAADAPQTAPLDVVGRWLTAYRERHGAFPVGTIGDGPLADRFGWQAQFREETEGMPIPDRTQSWRSPANEPFVRRKATELLFPGQEALASESGYPASHLAGMTGVGAESARLPKTDPRAGIFGENRRTSREDIRDGLSNTLLVVGVQSRSPAWAEGEAGLRGLTAEPYVNGPDGLGTGQADGMYVLLADGSVKFLSKDTDPKVFRRMAAMADGLPLDPATPGEPSPPPEAAPSPPGMAPNTKPSDDPPIMVELAPDRPPVDVAQQLAVPIRRFRLPRPTPLRAVLRQLVEMTAVPIDPSAIQSADRLDQLVTLDQTDVSLAEILSAALEQAELTYTIESGTLRLQAVPPAEPDKKSSPPTP